MTSAQDRLTWARAYASLRSADFQSGLALLAVKPSNKAPYTPHGVYDATVDLAIIAGRLHCWPYADLAWAVPESMVVVDLDQKDGHDGCLDFERLDGRDPHSIETPTALTPTGGLHLIFSAAWPYPNRVKLPGTAIDTRARGGYIVLPGPDSQRRWIRGPGRTPLAPAPLWLAGATAPKSVGPIPKTNGVVSREDALETLADACAKILTAPRSMRDDTRHGQCFRIGVLIGRGKLDNATGLAACYRAAHAMEGAGEWRDLERRVRASIERGVQRGERDDEPRQA